MSEQLDLLEWAANRQDDDSRHVTSRDVTLHGRYRNTLCDDSPAGAQVLDGRLRFERKAGNLLWGSGTRLHSPVPRHPNN